MTVRVAEDCDGRFRFPTTDTTTRTVRMTPLLRVYVFCLMSSPKLKLDMLRRLEHPGNLAGWNPLTHGHIGIANGCFFNMGARLGRYTGNQTYLDWADKTWDWMWEVEFIDHDTYSIYDGAKVDVDCKDPNKAEFTYNNAVFAQGCAFMFNHVSTFTAPTATVSGFGRNPAETVTNKTNS